MEGSGGVQRDAEVLIGLVKNRLNALASEQNEPPALQRPPEEVGRSGLGVLRVLCGLLHVALVPVAVAVAFLGSDGIDSASQFRDSLGAYTAVPLGLGLVVLLSALSRSPGVRVGLGLLLVAWVAPSGAVMAAGADWTVFSTASGHGQRDKVLTILEIGGIPGLMGFCFSPLAFGV